MQTQVLIIGAGATGTCLARDLSLRGVSCTVVEKKDINAGASGANHGLLHSGARYIASDPPSARECHDENLLIKRLAPHCIEDTGGLFVAVEGDDEKYISDFPESCRKCGIPVKALDPAEARRIEPALSPRITAAFAVDDATIDPFRFSLDNIAFARQHGCCLMRYSRVTGFETSRGLIRRTIVTDELTGRKTGIEAEIIVNASGAWADIIAGLAGAGMEMRYSKGSLLVTQTRITGHVVNRLRNPTDGDILAPGGTVSILGTTSERVKSPDKIYPETHEIDAIISEGATMIPELAATRYIRAYCGVRPLPAGKAAKSRDENDRAASRGYELIDHAQQPGEIGNLITITGGKLTTSRLMAEKTADMVCARLRVNEPCRTRSETLSDTADAKWTEPGLAPDIWLKKPLSDMLLCECEMVPQSVVKDIAGLIREQDRRPGLNDIALRSRMGKGPCQGTFCSQRTVAYLYDQDYLDNKEGADELRGFLRERWRGQQPLLWNNSLAQAELLEAMHCGLFSLEL